MKAFSLLLLAIGVWTWVWGGGLTCAYGESWQVDYSAQPDVDKLLATEMAIVDAGAKVDPQVAVAAGRRWYAYISVVEMNNRATYAADAVKKGVRLLQENKAWGSRMVDVSSERWADYVVEQLAKAAAQRGFAGFFLDTVDSWQVLAAANPGQRAAYRNGVLTLIKRLRATFPSRKIIMNRGVDLLPDLGGAVDGVMFESVFFTHTKEGKYGATEEATREVLRDQVAGLRAAKMPVYVLDYAAPGDRAAAAEAVKLIRELDAEPFVSTRELQGAMLGPVREKARRWLVLHGHVLAESETAESFPADTFAAERLQTSMEWQGWELEYLNTGHRSPPVKLDDRFAGIILDTHLQVPYAGEEWYVNWLLEHQRRGLKLIFCGSYPFAQDVQRRRLLKGLGCWGSLKQYASPQEVFLRVRDPAVMDFEAKTQIHTAEVEDTRAPDGARIFMSVNSRDEAANAMQFDAIYACSWGGALLDPYVTFQVTPEDQASLFNPFVFIDAVVSSGNFPAPDTSTRDGRRIFYSHIDGDGFAGLTKFAGKRVCAELVRDSVLKKYPFPVTVSLIEATTRGLEKGQTMNNAPALEALARDIFTLPHVQVGSHSYSHPYVWIDYDTEYIPQYETRQMVLDKGHEVTAVSAEREVAGSIEYINKLCPPGKQTEIMLWSGNCRPSPEAIRVCERLGIENMNGGGATVTKLRPYMSNIDARIMQWDGELQIFASHQNEFVYTRNWKGPFFGGFSQVIESFEMTEKPRRLKPVNIYYHFYSAATEGALKALVDVHEWSLKQPLHSVTAAQFAALTRDSWRTRVFEAGAGRWVMVNKGKQRTFRLKLGEGRPDMKLSPGVTGWVEEGGALFIHTDGRPAVDVVLTRQGSRHLYLESAQGEVTWKERSANSMDLTVTDLRAEHTLVLGGAAGEVEVQVGEEPAKMQKPDAQGRLVVPLRGSTRVRAKVLSP